jgi:cysteinyl-tRNA synthetase
MKAMDIYLHNSLSDQLELFIPRIKDEVSIYVCGPTVYNFLHIGNLRPVVVFDVLRKLFIHLGYHVKFVSNITDIDDKIVEKAHVEKVSEQDIATHYTKHYVEDLKAIASLVPDMLPTVTEHIESIIAFIQTLIDKGYAYQVKDNVYFRVSSIMTYGQLSNVDTEDLKSGSRVEVSKDKENPLDFSLWKQVTSGITFDAPFGRGRPGWHTECVVMIQESFKQPMIDIHAGGFDLKFPHHENEIAQAQAMYHTTLATYWLHNGFINIDAQKMSKSLGNVYLAKDFIKAYGGPLLRYVLLSTHYRMPVNMSEVIIENANNELNKIVTSFRQLTLFLQMQNVNLQQGTSDHIDEFLNALAQDINTANALTHVHALVKRINAGLRAPIKDLSQLSLHFFTIKLMFSILGLDLSYTVLTEDDKKIYREYETAKLNKDFEKSDALRKILIDKTILA